MGQRFAILAATLALLTAPPAASSAATIGQILGSPSTYDGQHVDVRGTVERLEQKVSHKGNSIRHLLTLLQPVYSRLRLRHSRH